MRKVDFLVAGVQKGGTSALFEYLRDLPALQLPAVKEAHFFDDEERVDWAAPDYAPYHALFADDDRLWGEATPIYCYWPPSLERIARYNPAIKLILVYRDPVERAWSQWKMEFARGTETAPFDWCIREGRQRMADAQPFAGAHRVFSYVERGFYGAQLSAARALFPDDQLLLLRSGDLARDPTAVLTRIAHFLGIDPPVLPVPRRRVREAAVIPYPSTLGPEDVAFLQRIYAEDTARFVAAGGPDVLGN